MKIPQLVYCVASFGMIAYLTSKAERKWFFFIVLSWLFSTPIIGDQNYPVCLHFAGIDLQPSRILFLFLLAMLLLFIVLAKVNGKSLLEYSVNRIRFFELVMFIYVWITILLMVVMKEMSTQGIVVKSVELSTFILLYFFARENISSNDLHLLALSIITFAVLSSLVGVYQFFGDSSFLRIGGPRVAFGSYIRASGLFPEEYDQGIFLNISLVVGIFTLQNRWGKSIILTTIPLGLFCTMHRASWVVFVLILGIMFLKEIRNRYMWAAIFIGGICVILLLFIVLNISLPGNFSGNFLDMLMRGRLFANTVDERINYYKFALEMMQKYPLGIGDYNTGVYAKEVYDRSTGLASSIVPSLVIHNGFLSVGVKTGFLGFILFISFVLASIIHFFKNSIQKGKFWLAPLMIMIIFLLQNLTNDFSSLGSQKCLTIALLVGGYVSAKNLQYLPKFNIQPFVKGTQYS